MASDTQAVALPTAELAEPTNGAAKRIPVVTQAVRAADLARGLLATARDAYELEAVSWGWDAANPILAFGNRRAAARRLYEEAEAIAERLRIAMNACGRVAVEMAFVIVSQDLRAEAMLDLVEAIERHRAEWLGQGVNGHGS